MKAAGVEPDVYTHSVVVSACEKGKQWELARKVFVEMEAAEVEPDVYLAVGQQDEVVQ